MVRQDPVLSRVKLIAEPWDLGPGGDWGGAFPAGWSEWNGRYRDGVRRFWRGDSGRVAELASRLSGSSDLFAPNGRNADASINFVTCHDGFTLRDLVSYDHKHNEANGEDNRDGTNDNWSRNWGVEGPTAAVEVLRLRASAERNLLATLAFSQGVPMLLAGDEMRPHPARQQQRLLPGQSELTLDRLEPRRGRARAARLHAPGLRDPRREPGAPPARLLPRPRAFRHGLEGRRLASARRARAHRARLARSATPTCSAC